MKLRSLAVNQFRKFTEPTRLDGIGDGLNLVIGPNEMGKSTLLAALRAVLFERHSSKARAIIELQNDRGGNAPVVEAQFDLDGAAYTVAKRFIKQPYARLECPDGVTLEGDGAEAKLRDLLGFSASGPRGADDESVGMWGVLWVRQGLSFGAPEISNAARASLSGVLESEVGEVLGGRRGRELPQLIEQQIEEWLTRAQRRPRGEYKEALEERDGLANELEDLRGKRSELANTLELLEAAQERAQQIESGAQDEQDREALAVARVDLQREIELEAKIGEERARLDSSERARDGAVGALSEREALRARLADTAAALARDQESLAELEERDRAELAQLEALSIRRRAAAEDEERAQAAVARRRDILALISDAREIERLEAGQTAALDAEQRLSEARRQIEAMSVNADLVERIRREERRFDRANAQLDAAATRITFDIPAERAEGVEVNGAPLTNSPNPTEAVEPVAIVIPERGRIVVHPNIENRSELLDERASAETSYRAALAEVGVDSLAQAEADLRRREQLERETALTRQALAGHAPDGVSALTDQLAVRRERLETEMASLEINELPQLEQAEADADRAREELAEALEAARMAREAYDERDLSLNDQRLQLSDLRAVVRQRSERVDQLREELDRARSELTDEDLSAAVAAREAAVAAQEQALAALTAGRSEAARELIDSRIARLERSIEARREERSELQAQIAGLQQRLDVQEAAGIDEQIAAAERKQEQAAARVDRFERQLAVRELALRALREAEQEARERYLAPVVHKVRPYLQMLFPQAEPTMDDALQFSAISREVGYEESFERLSVGTQEQLAVLIRLAFADLLAEQGRPAAVILDDALVFSDDQRMQTMFDILNLAAQRVQIIVFTCRAQLFEGLGAQRLTLSQGDPEELRSA